MKKIVLFIGFGEIQLELVRRFLAYRNLAESIEVRSEQGAGGAADGYVVNGDDPSAWGRLALHVRSNNKPILSVGAQAAPGSSVFAPGPFKPATADRLGEMMTGRPAPVAGKPPTAAGAQPAQPPAASKVVVFPRPTTHASGAQVLVVDDSEIVRRTMTRKITEYGHVSDLASNGEEAMAMLLNDKYRVIFLDVMMPGLDGLEICRRIKRSPEYKGTAVYMLTSKDGMFDRVRASMAGCDGYLVKPLESRKLREVLEKYFDRPSFAPESSIIHDAPLTPEEQAFVDGDPAAARGSNFTPTFAPTMPAWVVDPKSKEK